MADEASRPSTGLGKAAFELLCRAFFKVYCPLTVVGREHLPEGGAVFCSNHASHLDSVILMVASGRPFSEFAMVAARDYFFDRTKSQHTINVFLTLIPVSRKASREGLRHYLAACQAFVRDGHAGSRGRSLIIFPEGTRSRTGQMQPFKKGPALIATELGLPLVPAYIDGSFRAWPKGRKLIRPQAIRVHVGAPIRPEEYRGGASHPESAILTYRRVTRELESRIHELKEVSRRATGA